jgi:hypothetical protein
MRYLGVLKGDKDTEAGTPPTPEMMARMGTFIEEVAKAGVLLGTEGLQPSAKAKRVRFSDGKATVTDGPFLETKEVLASYGLFQTETIDEAVYWTTRFLEVLGQGECDIYPILDWGDESPDAFPADERAREDASRAQMEKNAATR